MTDFSKEMSNYKFIKDYAKWSDDKDRYESWDDAVDRVVDMHKFKYKEKISSSERLSDLIDFATHAYKDKLVLASQRSLQFGGEPTLRKEGRMYNCLTSYCDRPKFFQETMWWLLLGGGVGFSVQYHHVNRLPKILMPDASDDNIKTFTVPDTIEGWSDAFGVLLSSYWPKDEAPFPEYSGKLVNFDYSEIRPEGAMISGGFKAPGPDGLRASINKVRLLIDRQVQKSTADKFRPIDAYDIVMHMSDAVLSGGVRRSATICLFSPGDKEMLTAKTGDWFSTNPQRARSNNSALLVRGDTTREMYNSLFKSIKQFGEPGIVWANSTEVLYNPCAEIGFIPVAPNGKSSWQGCVSSDTKIITRNGIAEIGYAADSGQELEVWNGNKWSKVKPIKTGENRDLYRVSFSDGSFLDVTENHKFLVKNRFQSEFKEVETSGLLNLIKQSKYNIQVPLNNVTCDSGSREVQSYNYGYILGDGTVHIRGNGILRNPTAQVYEHEYSLISSSDVIWSNEYNGKGKLSYKNITFTNTDKDLAFAIKYNTGLPEQVFSWDEESISDFIAGWIDSDGTKAGNGFRIYGREDKIRDCQLLLTKVGVKSSINLMVKAGTKTNYTTRKNDVWYIQVSDVKNLWCNKFDMVSKPTKAKGKHTNILSVDLIYTGVDSYCFEEPELHQGLFGNVLTKQCNLTEINGGKIDTIEKALRAVKAATIFGTLQAGFTNFSYLDNDVKATFEKEALLGVSITGWMEQADFLFDEKLQKLMAEHAVAVNEEVAALIGINPAARLTCTKPSGNASVLLGTSSGIHPHHAERYFRNIQGNINEDIVQAFMEINPEAVETSTWDSSGKDVVISFPVIAPKGSKFKDDLLGVKLLEYVKIAQNNWVEHGTIPERCTDKDLRHNISNTITVDDWDEVQEYVWENKGNFAGISFLPMSGDKDFAQAPFTEVKTPEQLTEEYGVAAMLASGLVVDALNAFNNNLWGACDIALGINEEGLKELKHANSRNALKRDWMRRIDQFANRFFDGDLRKATYLLKDVHLLHRWEKITRTMVSVDWLATDLKPQYVDVNTTGAVACAGGACDVTF